MSIHVDSERDGPLRGSPATNTPGADAFEKRGGEEIAVSAESDDRFVVDTEEDGQGQGGAGGCAIGAGSGTLLCLPARAGQGQGYEIAELGERRVVRLSCLLDRWRVYDIVLRHASLP